MCNFGMPSVSTSAPVWDLVATSGDNMTDTFERVSLFIKKVFGESTYERVAAKGWGPCSCGSNHWWAADSHGGAACPDRPFFAPHVSHSESLAHKLTAMQRSKIESVFLEDALYYALHRNTRDRSGAAPGDADCHPPLM